MTDSTERLAEAALCLVQWTNDDGSTPFVFLPLMQAMTAFDADAPIRQAERGVIEAAIAVCEGPTGFEAAGALNAAVRRLRDLKAKT